jgi:hypothetical protein
LIHKWAGWVVTTGGDGLGSIAQVNTHWRTADPTEQDKYCIIEPAQKTKQIFAPLEKPPADRFCGFCLQFAPFTLSPDKGLTRYFYVSVDLQIKYTILGVFLSIEVFHKKYVFIYY